MKKRIAILVTLAALAAAAIVPAGADEVTVSVSNPGGSRTLFVENVLGQPLTALDFGTTRSQPFRVRVVDSTMDRSGFQVLTTMTKLYKVDGATYAWNDNPIPSTNLGISYPPDPLNLLDVEAIVTPVFNLTETLSGALCATVQTAGGSCDIAMTAVEGLRQTVDLVVDLTDLNSLPLIPQIGETGDFTAADYAGIGADDPNKPGTFTPTNRQVISGALNTAADTVTSISTALQALVAGQPASSLVDVDTLGGALRDAMTGPVFDALLPVTVGQIIDGLQAAVQSISAADIIGQSGTYLSYPQLDAVVPEGQAAGDYKGTLVVTAVQM
jgi:hypothetical protein